MTKLETKAREYRLPMKSTVEDLGYGWNTVINFCDTVLVAGHYFVHNAPCWYGAVYTYTTADQSCEGEIKLMAISEERFEDNGRALQWAMGGEG